MVLGPYVPSTIIGHEQPNFIRSASSSCIVYQKSKVLLPMQSDVLWEIGALVLIVVGYTLMITASQLLCIILCKLMISQKWAL